MKNSFSSLVLIISLAGLTGGVEPCPIGDLNANCRVDFKDLQFFVEHWLDPDCTEPNCGDLYGVDGVTMADFALLADNWRKMGTRLVISEFMASNGSTPEDEDGLVDADEDSSDWVEIYNPADSPINLDGWYLTDNDANLTKWQFPNATINAGDYLVVFASEKDRTDPDSELHTNFKLSVDGEYLALVMPDGETVASEYAPKFPEQICNISYGLSTDLRIYNLIESGASAQVLVPQDDGLGSSWTLPEFTVDGSWTTGPTGIGYDAGGSGAIMTAPIAYWPLDETSGSTAYDFSGNDHDGTLYGDPTWTIGVIDGALEFDQSDGMNCGTSPTPTTEDLTLAWWMVDNYSSYCTILDKSVTGSGLGYNILLRPLNEDSPLRFRIGGWQSYGGWGSECRIPQGSYNDGEWVHVACTYDSDSDTATIYIDGEVAENGPYNPKTGIVGLAGYCDGVNNPDTPLWVSSGEESFAGIVDDLAIWDVPLTQPEIASLAAGSPAMPSYANLIETDIRAQMQDTNPSAYIRIPFEISDPDELLGFETLTLRMKYDDGFVAYLNGREVARRNAPASLAWNSSANAEHPLKEALVYEAIDISAHVDALQLGSNFLAIHGLNVGADDGDFLIIPQLEARRMSMFEAARYFDVPTPGEDNSGLGLIGIVGDTRFSVDRGFYQTPFDVVISCSTDGATIRYTVNGSTPTLSNGFDYDPASPIHIDHTTCLRVAAFKDDWVPSNVDTHTYIFISDVITQSLNNEPPGPGWPGTNINGQYIDYEMDPEIVTDDRYKDLIDDALLSIPTISLVTDLYNLFDPLIGIYVNASNAYGMAWERPTSVELINPDGSEGFQIDAGLRIRGGWSRVGYNPKHAFRLFFRSKYGDAWLKFPWFEDEGVDEFKKMDIRCSQNYAWSFDVCRDNNMNTMNRDVYSRDLQGQMGQPYTRSRYYHLYLNGVYWGLFQTQERSEAWYAQTYFGGDRDNYDVLNCDRKYDFDITPSDGNLDAYRDLWDAASAGFETDESYYRVQGLNPDGTRNPDYDLMVDLENLFDYLMVTWYTGNHDGPILHGYNINNFYVIYNREDPQGFIFFQHDSEHSLKSPTQNTTGPYDIGDVFEKFNPQWLFQQLIVHPECRIRFADRVHKYFFNDGLLTPSSAAALFMSRVNEIDLAIIAETARWGDAKEDWHAQGTDQTIPITKDDWLDVINDRLANYFPVRSDNVLSQFKSKGWYPDVDAAVFYINGQYQHGGEISSGDLLTMIASSGTIYYTLDGSDPRLPGVPGEASPSAASVKGGGSQITLIPLDAEWKYLDDGTDQGIAWRDLDFPDGDWESGPAELGYGDGGEATVVSYGPYAGNKYITTYFRHTFEVGDTSQFNELKLELLRDDGAVVFLNGEEIARSNMPGTPGENDIFYNTTTSNCSDDGSILYSYSVSPSMLNEYSGNVIAVEIHQQSNTSSDISFNLKLSAICPGVDPSAIELTKTTRVKARVLDGGEWSALNDAIFAVGLVADNLRITEIMYHPPDSPAGDPNTEFIELKNIGNQEIHLDWVCFTNGIDFMFPPLVLGPGSCTVVVLNKTAFQAQYGTDPNVAGEYTGRLNNAGERIELVDAIGRMIQDFRYRDGWYPSTDGDGFSLTIIDPTDGDPNNWSNKDSWRPSTFVGGSPGTNDEGLYPEPGSVVINELLSHSHGGNPDWIELYNATDEPINIGGWYLSDSDKDDPNRMKYHIPLGTVIDANGYLVFYEDCHFGNASDPNCNEPFALSENGETVYLRSGLNGALTGYYADEDFGAAQSDVAFGRYYKASTNNFNFVAMEYNTPGSANADPKVWEVVINEIMYNPPAPPPPEGSYDNDDFEYIELYNRTAAQVSLYDEDGNPWRFTRGVEYTLPPDTTIPAHGYLLVVKDPDAFKARYPTVPEVIIFGPFENGMNLSNGGEKLDLSIPGDVDSQGQRQYIRIDRVNYSDGRHPENCPGGIDIWPREADGGGKSLSRIDPELYGNDVINWQAAEPSPGSGKP